MTNADKYLTVSTKEFKNAIINTQGDIGGLYSLEKWLDTEVKPTLTEDERVILRNIPKEYTIIRRNEWKEIEFVRENRAYRSCYLLSHLFQFIKERRRIQYRGVVEMITLNEKEKQVLKYLKSFKTICRTGTGGLWAVNETGKMLHLIGLSGLFQFIKNGEEYSIEELLKYE